MSSRASNVSITSNGSSASKEGKRAGKLAEAQAELLGCEEHLRSLEVRIEHERNKVMLRGLEDQFRSMETVAHMWLGQAKRGLNDLEKIRGKSSLLPQSIHLLIAADLPAEAYELDSNGSIAPSQSASQIGLEDQQSSPSRRTHGVPFPKIPRGMAGPGSITGSIAEEDENSSDDGNQGNLVMHENRPVGGSVKHSLAKQSNGGHVPAKPSPLGVPSVNFRSRPLSSTFSGGSTYRGGNANDSDSDVSNPRAGGRRAASDVGAMGYRPPTGRQPLRRTFSDDRASPKPARAGSDRAESDTSSLRRSRRKKGFFASISRFFKGPAKRREGSIRSGRDSPPYGSSSKGGGWHTRTDSNIKRSGSMFGGGGRRGGNDSSSDDDDGNLISVSNNRNSTWSADQVGRPHSAAGVKRSSTMPVASGLIPAKPTRKDLGANKENASQSTVTARNLAAGGSLRATSPLPSGARTPTPGISRSNTIKSTTSAGAKSTTSAVVKSTSTAGTARSGSVKSKTKTRANGSITRAAVGSQQAAEGRNIMSLVDMEAPPPMPAVPKAPKSHVTPQMELPKAPGSSIVPATAAAPPKIAVTGANGVTSAPRQTLSRSSSARMAPDSDAPRSHTPLPPSRTLSPPLKSALRPASPSPPDYDLAPPLDAPKNMYSISAPGPVEVAPEEFKPPPMPVAAPKPKVEPPPPAVPAARAVPPANTKRNSFQSTTDGESVYESAMGDEDEEERHEAGGVLDGEGEAETSSSEEENEEALEARGYHVVENDKVRNAGAFEVGPPEVVRVETRVIRDNGSTASEGTATGSPISSSHQNHLYAQPVDDDDRRSRKSVRITAPGSPNPISPHLPIKAPAPVTSPLAGKAEPVDRAGNNSPPPERPTDANWSTRIGRVRDDSSDEESYDNGYNKAKKGLIRNSGNWESVKPAAATTGSVKKRGGSVRSKSSKSGSARV